MVTAVTPCAGVWIEILPLGLTRENVHVTPCAGVWIEIGLLQPGSDDTGRVTPCAGVWIEILTYEYVPEQPPGHSLCGSVD